MEVSQTEVIAQSILGITSGFLNLQLTNHVSGRLSGVALVPSHLTGLKKSDRILFKNCLTLNRREGDNM